MKTDYEVEITPKNSESNYVFSSRKGVESPKRVLKEEIAVLKNTEPETTDSVLVIDSRLGIEGIVLGDRARSGRVMITSSEAREALLSEVNRRKNSPEASTEVMTTSNIEDDCLRKYDIAVYVPRKGTPLHLVKQKILEASKILRDEGKITVASGQKVKDRIKSFMDELGNVSETLEDDVSVLTLSPRNSTESPIQISRLKHSIKGEKIKFQAPKGLFNSDDMEKAEMLARESLNKDEDILDATQTPGLVGLFSSKLYNAKPVSISRNHYLKQYAEKNARMNNVEMQAFIDDGVEILRRKSFDSVKYIHKKELGKVSLMEDMENCFRILRPGGKVSVVHEKDSGIEKVMRNVFSEYSVIRREYDYQLSEGFK